MNELESDSQDGVTRALRHCDESHRQRPAAVAGMGLVAVLITAAMWVFKEVVSGKAEQ
jgi:hypothetical protein